MASSLTTLCRRFPTRYGLKRIFASSNILQPTRNKSWDQYIREDLWLKEEGAKSFAEIKEELDFKDPEIHETVDISLPAKQKQLQKKSERLKLLKEIKNDKTLEQAARLRKLHIPLEEVKKDWYKESWSIHAHSIADHYGVYQDLFGYAYFYPRIQLDISFDYDDEYVTPVHRGNKILPSEATEAPHVSFEAPRNTLWTLCLTSPDEHFLEEDKEYVHWLVGNIPGSDISNGEVLCNYLPPIPPRGTGHHRYIFILYKQDKRVDYSHAKRGENCSSLPERTFSTYEFYKEHQDYVTPAGLAFFQSEYDESVQTTFHNILNVREPAFEYDYPPDFHPEQQRYPWKKPFNLYLERYRDKKEIAEEVLKERLSMISPFKELPKQPKYPDVFFMPNKPQWWRLVEHHRRNREGKFKDLPK
ncbi:large ribosomal subunit protein mL38-like [Lineus longissimus]|uniref:large ribosomal subunit protein mL38-like n=1 Tax=Lineus longissimus TaxID=88925 RepID=UPI002B4DE69C